MNPSNKYGSKVDSFAAYDMYNLPLPVLPPADLTLAAGAVASTYLSFRNSSQSRVVDFLPTDNPYIRSLGLTSNLADGLVDASSSHRGGVTSWQATLSARRVGAALTGSITNAAGSASVTGVGTVFTQELAVGSVIAWVDNNGVQRHGTVLTVNADSGAAALTLTAVTDSTGMFTGATTTKTAYPLVGKAGYAGGSITIPFLQMNNPLPFAFFLADASVIYTPGGKITTTAGSAAVTGVGTTFLSDVSAGYVIGWMDDLGVRRTGVVASVASDTALTLTAVVPATGGGTNVPMLDLDYGLRILAEMTDAFFAYTVTIDPAFGNGTRRLSLAVFAEIEHTFGMIGQL